MVPYHKLLSNVYMTPLYLPCVGSFVPSVALSGSGEVLIMGPGGHRSLSCSNQEINSNLWGD